MGKNGKVVVDRNTDVSDWGEKEDRGNADYTRPFMVGGERCDLDALPKLGADAPTKAGK